MDDDAMIARSAEEEAFVNMDEYAIPARCVKEATSVSTVRTTTL